MLKLFKRHGRSAVSLRKPSVLFELLLARMHHDIVMQRKAANVCCNLQNV